MKKVADFFSRLSDGVWNKMKFGMRTKLIIIFLVAKVIPLILLTAIALMQFMLLGSDIKKIAVDDSTKALNAGAVENIERMTTDAAQRVAQFLYDRDDDILYLASIEPSEENYRAFVESITGRVIKKGTWELSDDGQSWVRTDQPERTVTGGVSTNDENNLMDGFNYRPPEQFLYEDIPLYDEITFVGLDGVEKIKVTTDSPKINYPMSTALCDVSQRENTYVKAETYFEELQNMSPGEIYVSDVTGAYVGTNFINTYTPDAVAAAAEMRGYPIDYLPEEQAYAGKENPNGQRFEGIVRWATPVAGPDGKLIGYVTLALNHDHIMEFVDHLTPMNERYTELPSAADGNYAFIWDYKCRSICHPRHHSIVGVDPETGDPQVPWLETSIYEAWQASGDPEWFHFLEASSWPEFDNQSRDKKPAPELTQAGLVGLDGRYLNNAPQCTGWMDMSADGGSGSFYILWSGLYKLTTVAAIPYYTGHYAPSIENGFSRRGFGVVTIGAGLDDFTQPSHDMELNIADTTSENLSRTLTQLLITVAVIIVIVVLIAVWIASFLSNNINKLIKGISRFRAGERHFRFNEPVQDEFGTLADSFDDMADSIVDSVNSPLCITDLEGKIIYMNDSGLELCRMTLNEIVGTLYSKSSVYPTGTKYCPITALQFGHETEPYFIEGQGIYMRGAANYLQDKDGQRIGYIIVSTNVTELVKTQLELEKAAAAANRANEHKGEFLARMSHEIRTPMNAIIGMTTLARRRLDEDQTDSVGIEDVKGHIKQIEASSQHLLGLLNDILDISKIEAGKIELTDEAVDLSRLAGTVVAMIKPRCDEKNITFGTYFEEMTPPVFMCDSLRLRQVLINLLGNAVKFTPECGRIEFHIECLDRREGETLVRFTVSDTGIGISKEALSTIFQPFEQASGGITRRYGGTGLGLAISRSIIQLLGGDIEVESTPGEGSSFSFSIWLREAELGIPETAAASDGTGKFVGKRALLVDDVEINRVIVKSLLEITGMDIDEAEDGLVAVNKFRDSPEGFYDIIFMDVQMPVMDGYEASGAIRELERSDARGVPIVALTANAFKEDIDRALRHGMNAHVAKPVEIDKLVEVLFRFVQH